MMHEREKSDPAIVAAKPANEAVSAAEERVEPRAGTKGNASGQSTSRTQGRADVSQALDRARTAAIHTDMQIKEKAMARTRPVAAKAGRYRPDDKLLAFLEAL